MMSPTLPTGHILMMHAPLPQLPKLTIDRNEAEHRLKSLTSREREVAQKITDGLTNKEIGLALQISARTVETHRQHIFSKLQIRDAVDLVHVVAMCGGRVTESEIVVRQPEHRLPESRSSIAAMGGIAVPEILFRNCYFPKPVINAVNVLMSWGPDGQPIGFVVAPPRKGAEARPEKGDQYKAHSLESAILMALGACLREGAPLAIVGDRAVWDEWLQARN